jgi:hypothetical protein
LDKKYEFSLNLFSFSLHNFLHRKLDLHGQFFFYFPEFILLRICWNFKIRRNVDFFKYGNFKATYFPNFVFALSFWVFTFMLWT